MHGAQGTQELRTILEPAITKFATVKPYASNCYEESAQAELCRLRVEATLSRLKRAAAICDAAPTLPRQHLPTTTTFLSAQEAGISAAPSDLDHPLAAAVQGAGREAGQGQEGRGLLAFLTEGLDDEAIPMEP